MVGAVYIAIGKVQIHFYHPGRWQCKLFRPRINVGLRDDDFGYFAFFFIILIQYPRNNHRNNDRKSCLCYIHDKLSAAVVLQDIFDKLINKDIHQQYPQCATQRAGVFVPLHPGRVHGKAVAEVEPGPRQIPVEMKIFESYPINDEQINGVGLTEKAASAQVKNHKYNREKQAVEQHRHDSTKYRRVPNPPGGEHIPNEKSNIAVLETTETMIPFRVCIQVIDKEK